MPIWLAIAGRVSVVGWYMKRIFIFSALWFFGSLAYGKELPSEFIGVWATEESVLEDFVLWGGSALYLDESGEGALVGAPLPVKKCGDSVCAPRIGIRVKASVAADGKTIRAKLIDNQNTTEIVLSYDSSSKTLSASVGGETKLRFVRRSNELPSYLRNELIESKSPQAGAGGR